MDLHFSIETSEPAQEFTPEQLEAQEAMQETGEQTAGEVMEAGENTPEYWQEMADRELDENGESDAYREYIAKANGEANEETMVGGWWAGYTSQEWLRKAEDALAQGREMDAKTYKENALKAMG